MTPEQHVREYSGRVMQGACPRCGTKRKSKSRIVCRACRSQIDGQADELRAERLRSRRCTKCGWLERKSSTRNAIDR